METGAREHACDGEDRDEGAAVGQPPGSEEEEEDDLPFAGGEGAVQEETHTTHAVGENEIRLRRTLATDAACAWILFMVWLVKNEAERRSGLARAQLYDQQTRERAMCERKYACDLQWVDAAELKQYCNTWNVPYAPNTLVHIENRRVVLQKMIKPSDKWWRPPEDDEDGNDDFDLRPPYVHAFKTALGFDFRVMVQKPSVYATQMLVAHVQLYNVQRATGDFHPEFTCYAYQYFFHERPAMRQEAVALLRTLTLIAKMHHICISDSSQAFGALVLRALLTCTPVTLQDVQVELQASHMAKRALGCV
jgi:hypothetical protein